MALEDAHRLLAELDTDLDTADIRHRDGAMSPQGAVVVKLYETLKALADEMAQLRQQSTPSVAEQSPQAGAKRRIRPDLLSEVHTGVGKLDEVRRLLHQYELSFFGPPGAPYPPPKPTPSQELLDRLTDAQRALVDLYPLLVKVREEVG